MGRDVENNLVARGSRQFGERLLQILRLSPHRKLLRALFYLLFANGLLTFSLHTWHILTAASFLTRIPLRALPAFALHLISMFCRVVCGRLAGNPRSRRWSFFVELFVECTRPMDFMAKDFERYLTPAIDCLTLLDNYGETLARICHPRVRMEHVTQGCPSPVTWVWFDNAREQKPDIDRDSEIVILYLHGGGYWAFTGKSHLEHVVRTVKTLQGQQLRVKACVIDYRKAPQNPWPAPVEDALSFYDWLQQGAGYSHSQVVLAGDSAGGGLCLCLLHAIRDAAKPMPLCAIVVSPLTDLSRTEEQYPKSEATKTDYLCAEAAIISGKYYCQGEDPKHPLISPKYGELHALPPILIQAGESELLAKDSVEYAKRLEAYGGTVQLEMYPDMPHIFPVFAFLGLEDAKTALVRQARFVKRLIDKGGEDHTPHRLKILKRRSSSQSFEDLQKAFATSARRPSSASSPVINDRSLKLPMRPPTGTRRTYAH